MRILCYIVPKAAPDGVSILYWRCIHHANKRSIVRRRQVSILYWRCLYALIRDMANGDAAMFQFSIGDAAPWHAVDLRQGWEYVSILYWRCLHVAPPARRRLRRVSILYWRCALPGMIRSGRVPVDVSILYWRCEICAEIRDYIDGTLVSILYWRCRVSWTFECAGF